MSYAHAFDNILYGQLERRIKEREMAGWELVAVIPVGDRIAGRPILKLVWKQEITAYNDPELAGAK